jgi:bifunctional non-homologous end joining protein LigD
MVTASGPNIPPLVRRLLEAVVFAFGGRRCEFLRCTIEADGATVFDHARRMGLEGIVSKRLDKPYRSGRSGDWIKTKNPDSPAMQCFGGV